MDRSKAMVFIGILLALNLILAIGKVPEWWAKFTCDYPHNQWSKTQHRCLGHGELNPDYQEKTQK